MTNPKPSLDILLTMTPDDIWNLRTNMTDLQFDDLHERFIEYIGGFEAYRKSYYAQLDHYALTAVMVEALK